MHGFLSILAQEEVDNRSEDELIGIPQARIKPPTFATKIQVLLKHVLKIQKIQLLQIYTFWQFHKYGSYMQKNWQDFEI